MARKSKKEFYTIYQTRTQLSKLLKRVRSGQEIYIAHGSTPIAKIVPFTEDTSPRKPGSAKGAFVMSADFDEPLPDEILGQFYK